MVCIPYATVPGMDTESCAYCKAVTFENTKNASTSNKRARTEPPYINGLADLQRRGGMFFFIFQNKRDF